MTDDDTIGLRIRRHRRAAGLTQTALAQKAQVSLSLLRKVEQGSRLASQPVLASLAKALPADLTTLTGQPYYREGPHPDRIHTAIPNLRRALAYWDMPSELDTPPRGAQQLAQDAGEIARLYQLDRNTEVVQKLPPLLMEAFAMVHGGDGADGDEREALYDALMGMFYAAHAVTYQTGYEDLSSIVEDRIRWVAAQSQDPVKPAFASWIRTTSLMRLGAYEPGLRMLERTLDEIDPGASTQPGTLRMTGSLHLRSAILAARANKPGDAVEHIAEARQVAAHLGTDTDNDWAHLAFGPSNVSIHAVATSVESGEGPRALALAHEIHFPDETVRRLPIRIAHHHMDLARAHFWQGQNDRALTSLERAKKFAPQQTRHHPTTREVTRMLVRAHNRKNESLARFSTWLGKDMDWS